MQILIHPTAVTSPNRIADIQRCTGMLAVIENGRAKLVAMRAPKQTASIYQYSLEKGDPNSAA